MKHIFVKASGKKNLEEITSLNLSKRSLDCLDISILNLCSRLKSLDVSKNKLKTLSGINLPSLKELNFEENSITDVTFLSGIERVEHLYCDGNPLNVADRYIAVDQLQHLVTLDGKSCIAMRKNITQFEERLITQVQLILKSKYESLLKNCTSLEEFTRCQKQLAREVLHRVSSSCSVPPKFQRHKVQTNIEVLLKDTFELISSNLTKNSTLELNSYSDKHIEIFQNIPTPRKSPRKKALPSTPIGANTTSKNTVQSNGEVERLSAFVERKRKYIPDLNVSEHKSIMSYEPHMFIRCHSKNNDPQDFETAAWTAAFEPDLDEPGKTLETVATCGRNIVCFINCQTGHILKRYKIDSSSENLYAIDWTSLDVSGSKSQKSTIVATAGLEKVIYLIHPSQLKCYFTFKAHTKAINCLQFHPEQKSWLFSGSRDGCINLWDIGILSLPDYKTSHQKLMTFKAKSEVSGILLSSVYNCLFASSLEGLEVWNLSGKLEKWTGKPSISLIVPDSLKSEKSNLVDGIAFVSTNIMAGKVSRSGKIFLWDISSIFINGQLIKKKVVEITPTVVFLWSDCDSDYNNISSCKGYALCCGDDAGRLWVYDIQKYNQENQLHESELELPTVVLPWPDLKFDSSPLAIPQKIIINSVKLNWNGNYLVACTDSNFICIWKNT